MWPGTSACSGVRAGGGGGAEVAGSDRSPAGATVGGSCAGAASGVGASLRVAVASSIGSSLRSPTRSRSRGVSRRGIATVPSASLTQ
jgi:hypothetical protein